MNINLDSKIEKAIQDEADEMGLTPEELLKVVLGERFRGPRHLPFPASPNLVLPGPLPTIDPIMMSMVKILAIQGLIKCPSCSLSVTISDVKKGRCSRCEAKLEF